MVRLALPLPLAVGLLLIEGCDKREEPVKQAAVIERAQPAGIEVEAASKGAGVPGEPAEAAQPVFVPKPLGVSLDGHRNIAAVGWSPGGEVFAVRQISYGWEGEFATELLKSVEVHDALGAGAVARYIIRADDDVSRRTTDEASGNWDESQAKAALGSAGTKPDNVKLKFKARGAPAGTTFTITPTATGASWTWSPDSEEMDGMGFPEGRVTISVHITTPSWEGRILMFGVDGGGWDCCVDRHGTITTSWDPTGNRFAILFQNDSVGNCENSCADAKWFIRGVGPQINLTDGGVGALSARAVAAQLDEGGHPVAMLSEAKMPVEESKVYYRGKGEERAAVIAKMLDVPLAEKELGKRGWTDVIVVLGMDQAAGPGQPTAISLDQVFGTVSRKRTELENEPQAKDKLARENSAKEKPAAKGSQAVCPKGKDWFYTAAGAEFSVSGELRRADCEASQARTVRTLLMASGKVATVSECACR